MSKPVKFNPDDPTVWLWKRLLRKKPESFNRAEKTKAEQKALAKKLRLYYLDHQHPRQRK